MSCLTCCFGNKQDYKSPTHIIRKPAESRRVSIALKNMFRGASLRSEDPKEINQELKSFNTTTNLFDKPLQKLITNGYKRASTMHPIEVQADTTSSNKKKKKYWVAKDKIHCYFCGGQIANTKIGKIIITQQSKVCIQISLLRK